MKTKRALLLLPLLLIAAGFSARCGRTAETVPSISGKWTGTWGPYIPEGQPAPKQLKPMKLDCTVSDPKDGVWEATFTGEAGGPYKYTINMKGRQSGPCVLFKGTVDLGPKGGGEYDWIGRADGKEFLGFYTSAAHSGVFKLKRAE